MEDLPASVNSIFAAPSPHSSQIIDPETDKKQNPHNSIST